MKDRIKSLKDYLCYVSRHNISGVIVLIVEVLLLFYAIYDYQQKHTWIAIVVAVFAAFIWPLYSILSHFKAISKVDYTKDGGQLPIVNAADGEQFKLTQGMKTKYKQLESLPNIYVPVELQACLPTEEPIHIHVKASKTREVHSLIQSTWTTFAVFLSEKYHRTKKFFNEKKLCMASEITRDGNQLEAYVCEGEYYNSYLTNEIYNFYLLEESGAEFHSPYDALNYEVPLLDESVFSNHIGVSTLLLTCDEQRHVCLLVQQRNSSINPGKIVPTGSGSVDFLDLQGLDDLKQVIIRAADRELKEETMFDVAQCKGAKTRIIGFYRDMARGGKPEFCCVTEVPLKHNEITIKPQVVEQLPKQKQFCALEDKTWKLQGLNLKFEMSNTLKANLYFLAQYLSHP